MKTSCELHANGRRGGGFLLALSVMCLSALAIGSILLSWFVGGLDYVKSFYGTHALATLLVAFLGSAYFYGKAKRRTD
ncbi:MAG: hypothetical protein ROZ00_04710 [Denitratisoma sp.]|nr:hypothetical protein [Denitratisoma sp.]